MGSMYLFGRTSFLEEASSIEPAEAFVDVWKLLLRACPPPVHLVSRFVTGGRHKAEDFVSMP